MLILFAHPALEKSRVNRQLIGAVRELEGVTFHDLYESYPDFDIRIEAEQQRVEEHDILVFQHPFFWYSTPALVKQWEDLVLEHGWAYGSKGKALHGKRVMTALTAGGRESAYRSDGLNRFGIRELLAPFEQTAVLCGMEYLPPFAVHGTHAMESAAIEQAARDYRAVIEGLRDDTLDLEAAADWPRINADMGALLGQERSGDDDAR